MLLSQCSCSSPEAPPGAHPTRYSTLVLRQSGVSGLETPEPRTGPRTHLPPDPQILKVPVSRCTPSTLAINYLLRKNSLDEKLQILNSREFLLFLWVAESIILHHAKGDINYSNKSPWKNVSKTNNASNLGNMSEVTISFTKKTELYS